MKNSVARTQAEKTYDHEPRADNLPLAIGANFHDDPINRSTLRKSHNLLLDRKADYAPHTEYLYSGTAASMKQTAAASRRAQGEGGDDEPEVWEGWFTEEISPEDQKYFVVNMLAYFVEKTPESDKDEETIRMVCIRYYVDDNSISITEAKQGNSGIVQGRILSRRQVPKELSNPEDLLLLEDFQIGGTVKIYGRDYVIADFDKRSRRYFEECLGQTQPSGIAVPVDEHTASMLARSQRKATCPVTSDDMDRRRNAEQQLTGIYTKHSNEDLTIAQQFLKNAINDHFTYLAIWDDRGSISGDLHFCIIRLYLENYAIEIVEQRPENSGRFGSPILVSRQRIPRPGVRVEQTRHQEHTYGKLMKSDYLCPEDIQIGETYQVFGKPFYVYDCDARTRNAAKEKYGIELKPKIDITPFVCNDEKPAVFYPPPPNGFGSEREERTNWLSLTMKAAKPDMEKIRRETGRIMNFTARLAKPLSADDAAREFVITFYRETGELEIGEKVRRNSGFIGGRFLAKGKHRKALPNGTTAPFEPSDFVADTVVTIFERPFYLIAADEGTKRIMEGLDTVTTEDTIKSLVVLLKQQISLKFTKANEAYLALAPQGTFGHKQIKEFLRSCSCDISDNDAVLVVQNLCPESSGTISFESFQRLFNLSAESMDEASFTTRSVRNVNMTMNDSFKQTAADSEDKELRNQLKMLLQQKLIQRAGALAETFRVLGEHSYNSRMNCDAFRRALNPVLHINMGKKEEDMLVAMLFDGAQDENGDITYKQFQDFVDSL